MKKLPVLGFVLFTLLLFSCSSESEKQLCGDWVMKQMKISDDYTVSGGELGYPKLKIEPNHTFEIKVNSQPKKGKWRLEKEILMLKADDETNYNQFNVIELNDSTLIYQSVEKESAVVTYIRP